MKETEKALRWITNILEESEIPFQIIGGFAAYVYGSGREIVDIDIAIPESSFSVVVPKVKEYIMSGPGHYVDEEWELQLITLKYCGQEIDLAGAYEKKFFNLKKQEWVAFPTNFGESEYREIYGIPIPLIHKEKLIEYKQLLSREVDVEDVKALNNQPRNFN